jgi:hypothetical protein
LLSAQLLWASRRLLPWVHDSHGHTGELRPAITFAQALPNLGAATAQALRDSPYRVALLASSSWSHAFLVDSTWRLRPDTSRDRSLYAAMVDGDYERWRSTSLQQVEDAGQQEVLNWWALLGAMEALDAKLEWSQFVETHIFNSNKVFAIFESR